LNERLRWNNKISLLKANEKTSLTTIERKYRTGPGSAHLCSQSAPGLPRQEDREFEVFLGYIARLCLKKKKTKQKRKTKYRVITRPGKNWEREL
jgi:hypothetical protein